MKNSKNLFIKILIILLGLSLFVIAGQAAAEEDEEGGGVIIFTKPVQAVIFDHTLHMEMGLDCESCHDDPFEMEAGIAEENDDFTMKSLYEGKYCGVCHDGDTAFASDTRCTACHIGVRGYQRMNGQDPNDTHGAHH